MTRPGSLKTKAINTKLIAPCGMNCRLCIAYVREKDPCPGCRQDDRNKPITRFTCRIKNCDKREKHRYCLGCVFFPCDRLEHLDKRYRTKYGMSMIENLMHIKTLGIRSFINNEKKLRACRQCGRMLCVHKPQCLSCGHKWR